MRYFAVLLFVQTALSVAITSVHHPCSDGSVTTTTSSASYTSTGLSGSITQPTFAPTATRAHFQTPLSALVTLAPLAANPLEKRQHCWNDQGFSVDCATWTGYYYTWGPAGNPYEGGPGEGGGNSGSNGGGSGNNGGGGTVTVYQNEATCLDWTSWSAILGLLCLFLAVFI